MILDSLSPNFIADEYGKIDKNCRDRSLSGRRNTFSNKRHNLTRAVSYTINSMVDNNSLLLFETTTERLTIFSGVNLILFLNLMVDLWMCRCLWNGSLTFSWEFHCLTVCSFFVFFKINW